MIGLSGGDAVALFETTPLESILADIAEGWKNIQQCVIKINNSPSTTVGYVF